MQNENKSKGIFYENRNDTKAGVANSYQTKQTLKQSKKKKDKEGYYIMIKGSTQEEDVTLANIYAPYRGAPKYIKQILTDKREKLTIIQ